MTHLAELAKIWHQKYEQVPSQLEKVKNVGSVVTAFNANVDAVLKISGQRLQELIAITGLTAEEFADCHTNLETPRDVVHGIAKCFACGIAEEWLTEEKSVYDWMSHNLGYDRLQMGGQGGIVANIMALLGVEQVFAHTNSHPQLQAEQFLDLDNLLAFDEHGNPKKATTINRTADTPLIHWIIEFDKGDIFEAWGKHYICPKSNRFIATYDPANLNLVINDGFVRHVTQHGFDYLILSGYHALSSHRNGVELIANSAEQIKNWKQKHPNSIIHLELASTQDKAIRTAIIEKIAPLADSLGLNEREALDALEIISPQKYATLKNAELTASCLFEIIRLIKEKTGAPRIQLHMFGLYITLQNSDFHITPQQNLQGMMLAATIAATKAGTGKLDNRQTLLWAHGQNVGDISLQCLCDLAECLHSADLCQTGLATVDNMNTICVPTILIEKPLTLVGMGDTISSVSLIGAR